MFGFFINWERKMIDASFGSCEDFRCHVYGSSNIQLHFVKSNNSTFDYIQWFLITLNEEVNSGCGAALLPSTNSSLSSHTVSNYLGIYELIQVNIGYII